MNKRILTIIITAIALVGFAVGCKGKDVKTISIDGSSTVFPITEAVAEEFGSSVARVTIGVSGTGGGMQKFCAAEVDITGASRPIKPTEVSACAEAGIEFIEVPVAYDGLAVVVHASNSFVDYLTVDELKRMWEPAAQRTITNWNQIRPTFPSQPLNLFGPGVDSGTYDYFTKAIVGEEHASRGDFTSSEDDNVIVQGVATDENALGFFGYAYYEANRDRLRVIPIEDGDATNGAGPIEPSPETVANSTYQPLSRPIFIYINKAAAERQEIKDFVHFYLREGRSLVREVGYIPLPDSTYDLATQRFDAGTTGSVFGGGGSRVGVSAEDLLRGN